MISKAISVSNSLRVCSFSFIESYFYCHSKDFTKTFLVNSRKVVEQDLWLSIFLIVAKQTSIILFVVSLYKGFLASLI